ncbi:MAG: OmpA family protein [Gemmatimonadales bacterium]
MSIHLAPCRAGRWLALALILLPVLPLPADAQIGRRIGRALGRAAEQEATRQLEDIVRDKVRCVFDDLECIRKAEESGKGAVLTDDKGEILLDADGNPVTDPAKGKAAAAQAGTMPKPGEGAWANYDFTPGDEILLYEDFSRDRVGDFPRRFELVQGSFEIIEWEGGRYLRALSNGLVAIPLPAELPERFTVEFAVSLNHGNAYVRMTPGPAYFGRDRSYAGSAITVEASRAGLRPVSNAGPEVLTPITASALREGVVPIRVMGDGDYLKIYFGERRVANVPNAVFPRSDKLYIAVGWAMENNPIMIGPIRVASGGLDLYDRLERDGRVATQGILFATNSARIRPESTPTLEEIARILRENPALRLGIEGHTDADGDDAHNLTLSEQRAAAVKTFLVEEHRIAEGRLQPSGHGESKPVADNASPEGKQQNRRVELVKLDN